MLQKKAWHDGGVFARQCDAINAQIGEYLGTTFVARDMLEIMSAVGEDQLQYFGLSYGTVLGQTFAGMFPDRVKRMVLDSTLRLDDYWSGYWQTTMRDTERTIENFFEECVNAGPVNCPLANFTGTATTAQDLIKELANALQELLDHPIYLPDSYQSFPWWQPGNLPLYQELKYILLSQAYYPTQYGYLYLAVDIALRRAWQEGLDILNPPPSNSSTPAPVPWNLGIDSFHGIACADGTFRANKPEDMYSLVQSQQSAGAFGDVISAQIWPCAQWKKTSKEVYKGPFTAINTSYPILFVQGNHDPVTPLSGAYEASSNFPGSRIVVQNGHGHYTRSHPSKCTNKIIADYFISGKMPEVGLVCQTDKTAYEVYIDSLPKSGINGTANSAVKKRSVVPDFRKSFFRI